LSNLKYSLDDVKTLLLVGGLGTRLRSVVPSTPKPLASVGERPFLELLVGQLSNQGIRHLVMCTGYLAGEIEREFGDGRRWNVAIEYSRELQPMGTAGAVKLAGSYLSEVPEFLVMNGDSFMELDLQRLIYFHRGSGGLASMAVFHTRNDNRYGTVQMDKNGRVTAFAEKTSSDVPAFVNAGVYVFDRKIFSHIPDGPCSLERDVFPKILDHGLFASEQQGVFIDIGTPEDYSRAQDLSARLHAAAQKKSPTESSN